MFTKILCVTLFSYAMAGMKNCGVNPLFTITELSQDPVDTIMANQNLSLTLKYMSPEEITSGSVKKSITLNFIPFSPTTEDLCANTQCPITIGEHDGSSWSLFPSGVSGTLVSKVVWNDAQGRELLCVQSSLKASAEDKSKALWNLRGY
jgi:hypothetical protein